MKYLSCALVLAMGVTLSACQTTSATRADAIKTMVADSNYANEKTDWGVQPRSDILLDGYHSRTPASIPGVRTLSTADLQKLIAADASVVLVDVLGGNDHATLPQSTWLKGAGLGKDFSDPLQNKFGDKLAQLTNGDMKRQVVFFCLSAECWLSYNASLRAHKLGYQNVSWYRGGIEAWKVAGLPTAPTERGW